MGLGTIGAIAGNVISGGDRGRADSYRNEALAEFANIPLPDIEKMKLALEQYSSAGTLSPEMVELISQADTALSGVSTDPRLRESQLGALGGLEELASRGMSSSDLAAMELARRNAASEAQAKQNQILQNMQQRGVGGSGAELAASLMNSQSSADRLQQAQLEEAKMRQAAMQQALMQQANAASGLRTQDYNEAANVANARDAIARFNAQNAQNVGMTNTQARNAAQQTNLTNAQNIRNMNTQSANQQQQFNKQLQQQQFENQMRLASGKSGAFQQAAQDADARAGRTQTLYSGVGSGLQNAINSIAAPMSGGTVNMFGKNS